MDVTVRTGSTKSPRDVSLASLSLQSMQGEQAWLVMEVEAAGREAQTVERECEAVVKHALLEAEGDAAVRLDSTLKELNGLLKGLLVSKSVSGAHMVLSILDASGVLHVSHAGQAEAYLIRKGVASQITEYSGKPAPAFVHISSGQLEARDIVVFSTARLLRTITPAQLSQMAQRDTFLEDLVRRLEGEGEYAALAATNVASGVVMEEEVPSTRMPSLRDRRARSMPRGGNAVLAIVMKYLPSSDAVNKSLKNIIASINGLFTSGSVSRAGDMLKDPPPAARGGGECAPHYLGERAPAQQHTA
jgi:hypothetical protein